MGSLSYYVRGRAQWWLYMGNEKVDRARMFGWLGSGQRKYRLIFMLCYRRLSTMLSGAGQMTPSIPLPTPSCPSFNPPSSPVHHSIPSPSLNQSSSSSPSPSPLPEETTSDSRFWDKKMKTRPFWSFWDKAGRSFKFPYFFLRRTWWEGVTVDSPSHLSKRGRAGL